MASVAKCVAKRPLCMSGYVKRVASDLLAFQSAYSLWPPDSCASSKQKTQKEALDLFLIIIAQKVVDKINLMEQSTSSCRFPLCVPQIHWWWVLLKMRKIWRVSFCLNQAQQAWPSQLSLRQSGIGQSLRSGS